MIMVALLAPAAVQALLSMSPDLLEPRDTAFVMALSLSGTIVATALLIAALVRGTTRPSSDV
jgi:hypothetical protein